MNKDSPNVAESPKGSLVSTLIQVISVPSFFFAVVLSLLVVNVRKGPDYNTYLHWSRAAVRGDIDEIKTYVESPMGLPLTQWCAGPGLAAAPLVGLCNSLQMKVLPQIAESGFYILVPPILDEHGVFLTAAIFSVVFWCAMARLVTILTEGQTAWTVFGLGAAFVGTHLGYYSVACGAELLSLAPIALLAVELARPMKSRLGSVILVGSCTAVLIMIRPYLALYAGPTLVVTAARIWQDPAIGRRLVYIVSLAGIAGIGVGQVALVNAWMTGSWTSSPYVFGDGNFKSFDFFSPEIAAVLFHPLHGLFAYHPMYLIGFVAMGWLVVRAPRGPERWLWVASLVVVAIHIWIQAAWYQWWLATTATFGMRGMAAAGIPCVAAMMRLVQLLLQRDAGSRWGLHLLTTLVGVTGIWSWLLMTRNATDYYTYGDLFASQRDTLRDMAMSGRMLTLAFAGVITGISLGSALVIRKDRRWSTLQQIVTIVVATLSIDFLVWGWIDNAIMSVQYAVVLIACILAAVLYRMRERVAWTPGPLSMSAGVVSALVLAMMLGWFAHLAIPTQRQITTDSLPEKPYKWKETFFVTEVQNGYRDFSKIPGFEQKRERLKQFLIPYGLPEITDTDEPNMRRY